MRAKWRGAAINWAGPFPYSHRTKLEALKAFSSRLNTSDLFTRCLQELQRKAPPMQFGITSTISDFANGILDYQADCVSLGPIGKLLGQWVWTWPTHDQQALSLIGRLAQEWFRLHGFLMHQGVEQASQEDVILRESAPSGASNETAMQATPPPARMLATMERGLAFGYSGILRWVLGSASWNMAAMW